MGGDKGGCPLIILMCVEVDDDGYGYGYSYSYERRKANGDYLRF